MLLLETLIVVLAASALVAAVGGLIYVTALWVRAELDERRHTRATAYIWRHRLQARPAAVAAPISRPYLPPQAH